ncbi:MAG TPA: hypothetical protein VGG28_21765 [Kofleriaceae bacterium]|jgi:hypothetical protein
MPTRLLLVLLAIAACDRTASAPPPAKGSAGSADPWVAKPAAPDTPAKRQARAEAALGRVAGIMPKLAKIRQLDFKHDIPRELQSPEDFRKFVHDETARELPPDKSADMSKALYVLGLLEKPLNLAEIEEQAFATQAAAYYDPKQKKFFIVIVPDSDAALDMTSAHELTHGLQDQHFDLQTYLPDEGSGSTKLDDDASAARRFVVEGDATFTMFLYMEMEKSPDKPIPATAIDGLVQQLGMFTNMSSADLTNMGALMGGSDPSMKAASDAMKDIPATVMVPMLDSYFDGALVVAAAYKRGGWPAVDDLFVHPPESTAQMLHPDKLFAGDHPHHVTLPKLAGKALSDVVFGELQWQVYFSLWDPAQAKLASAGWGGDHESVVTRADGRPIARIATTWDTPKDADEFTSAYVASLAKRFPKGSGDPTSATGFDRGDGAGKIFVKHDGLHVFAIDGADSATELAALVAGTKIAP